jgi:hypothetical protein
MVKELAYRRAGCRSSDLSPPGVVIASRLGLPFHDWCQAETKAMRGAQLPVPPFFHAAGGLVTRRHL